MKRKMKAAFVFTLILFAGLLFLTPAKLLATDVEFMWDPYDGEEVLGSNGGYKLFRRTVTGAYDYEQPFREVADPIATTTGEINIPSEDAYYVLRAYDYRCGDNKDEYCESENSNEVFFTRSYGDTIRFIWIPHSEYMAYTTSFEDRQFPRELIGRRIDTDVYIHVLPDTGITQVDFYIDDPGMANAPSRTEQAAPYDLMGGTAEIATPLDTKTLSNGDHILIIKVTKADATVDVVPIPFTVYNP